MTLAGKRKASLALFVIALIVMAWTIRHYRLDTYAGDVYTENFGNKLQRSLKKAAGGDAVNCGTIRVAQDSTTSNECAPSADAKGQAFLAVYAIDSRDGLSYRGLARTPDGNYKEYVWKPANTEEANAIFEGPDPELVPCADPHTLRKTWQGVPTCTNDR